MISNWALANSMFEPEELAKLVQYVVPVGHKDAVVGIVDKTGLQVVVGLKLNDSGSWELQGSYEHTWSGDNNGKIKILWSR